MATAPILYRFDGKISAAAQAERDWLELDFLDREGLDDAYERLQAIVVRDRQPYGVSLARGTVWTIQATSRREERLQEERPVT